MVPSLWIGPPGRLREIPDAAREFDRSVSLGVSEFQAMGGGVTVTSLPTPPRRLALSWTGLLPDHADWLDAMARRVFGPGPLGVLDPTARNLLDGAQSQGYGPLGAWQLIGPGSLSQRADQTVTITGTDRNSQLYWQHPYWPGWPVVPGQWLTFASSLVTTPTSCFVAWTDPTGSQWYSSTTDGTGGSMTLPPRNDMLFVRPAVYPGPLTTPVPIGQALLRMTTTRVPATLGPVGDGGPAMAVTGYTDNPTTSATARDLSLSLVEVRRAGS